MPPSSPEHCRNRESGRSSLALHRPRAWTTPGPSTRPPPCSGFSTQLQLPVCHPSRTARASIPPAGLAAAPGRGTLLQGHRQGESRQYPRSITGGSCNCYPARNVPATPVCKWKSGNTPSSTPQRTSGNLKIPQFSHLLSFPKMRLPWLPQNAANIALPSQLKTPSYLCASRPAKARAQILLL